LFFGYIAFSFLPKCCFENNTMKSVEGFVPEDNKFILIEC